MDAGVVNDDVRLGGVALARLAGLAVRADYHGAAAAGKQFFLHDRRGDQRQRGEQEKFPPRELGDPGRRRVETFVQPGEAVGE